MINTKINNFLVAAVSAVVLVSSPATLRAGDELHWNYTGQEDPAHWGELADEYRMCSEGENQSPIDLVGDIDVDLPELQFNYISTLANDVYNGHTIQQDIEPGSFISVPEMGWVYELKQFHFHSPSEHTVNGESFAMELHFVHANEAGALLVVGVLVRQGEANPVLAKMKSFMPAEEKMAGTVPISIEESNLLPPTRDYFYYNGSLTTPPCSEGVRWVVLKTPIEASEGQIATFKARVGPANNRPVQSHNARMVLE